MAYLKILIAGRLQDTQCLFNEILHTFKLDTPLLLPYTSASVRVSIFRRKPLKMYP
jgi:hypothetical protein